MCECDKIVKKCIGAINKFFYLDRVDKTKIRHYTDLNNIANKKVKECIELAHEYQREIGITGECITNIFTTHLLLIKYWAKQQIKR